MLTHSSFSQRRQSSGVSISEVTSALAKAANRVCGHAQSDLDLRVQEEMSMNNGMGWGRKWGRKAQMPGYRAKAASKRTKLPQRRVYTLIEEARWYIELCTST